MRGYPIGHPNRYALQLLAVVLGGGMSSRLFTEVRERRGLGYYVHAGNDRLHRCRHVLLERRSRRRASRRGDHDDPRRDAEDGRRAGSRGRAREGRGYAKGRFVLRLESPQGTIQYGLRREVLEGEIEEPEELLERLDEVTVEDVQRVAKDLFEDKRLYLAVVGPFDDPARFEKLLTA